MEKHFRKTLITQIGILTDDIQRSKSIWEKFLSLPPQPVTESEDYDKTGAVYRGGPLHGRIRQVCFAFGNIELELIQPIGDTPSYWLECLTDKGYGIHHISFAVKNMEECIHEGELLGLTLTQKGEFPGGRYAYLDGLDSMHIVMELLEKDEEVF